MSSVLRALQKLEQEAYAASGMPGKPGVKTGHGFQLHVNPVRQYRLLVALALLLLILTGLAAMFAGKTLLFPAAAIEPTATRLASPEIRQEPPVIHAEPSEMSPESEGLSPEIVATPPVQVVAQSSDQDAGIPADIIEDDATYRVINKDTVLPAEADPVFSRSSGAVSAPAAEDFPELDPSAGLTLQAISWSADPARRLAVINGRLCREGEPVDRFVLVRINPEDVLLSDGRISGKLVFKIR